MDGVTMVTCRKPSGTTFEMRLFGDGSLRFSSRGPVEQGEDGKWRFSTKQEDGVEIVE